MNKNLCLILLLILICSSQSYSNESIIAFNDADDSLLTLHNPMVTLTINRFGGALSGFSFNNTKLNPLTWKLTAAEMPDNNRKGAPFQGHFLCIGRWGAPSAREIKAGIPHNGEPSNNWWNVRSGNTDLSLEMISTALLEPCKVERTVKLSDTQSCFVVEEKLENTGEKRLNTAIVQHATFGPPFIDEKTIFSTNAALGFNQSLIHSSLTRYEYRWPYGFSDTLGTLTDLRKSDSGKSYVSTHVIDDEFGWATAANKSSGLLIGYFWKTSEYPWVHFWQGLKNDKLWARAIEFGTTGIGDTYDPETRAVTTFHTRNNNLFLDPESSISKKYFCFLIKIPEGYSETKSVVYRKNRVEVTYLVDNKEFLITFNSPLW